MVGVPLATVNQLHVIRDKLGWRRLVWGAVVSAGSIALCFIPLFNLLGFESSFAVGLAAAFFAVDLGHDTVARARRRGEHPALWPSLGRAFGTTLVLLAIPLLLLLLNAVRVKNCSISAGLGFFALLPLGTVIFATPIGVLCGLHGPRNSRGLAWSIPSVSMVWSLLRLYRDPPVHLFDPFGGFFPGPIYDEALSPTPLLLQFRLVNLCWIGTAVFVSHATNLRRRRPWILAGLMIILSLGIFSARGKLGFHRDAGDILATLTRTRRTPHFIVHSNPHDGETPAQRLLFERDLEFRYAQLQKILGVEPGGPVRVFRFADADEKKRLVGAANTLFAKPWRREIFIHVSDFPDGRLRHELAHVFAAAFGDPWFGVALSFRGGVPTLASGLIEGVAEAADFGDPRGRQTLHQSARSIIENGRAPDLASVVGAGFSLHAGANAYTLAASFCHYLLQTHGADRLRTLYRSAGDYPAAYGRDLSQLDREWRAFLTRQPRDEMGQQAAREIFREPAIFKKVCARSIAVRREQAHGLRDADPERAIALLESVCADDPGEPRHKLALAESLAAGKQLQRAAETAQALFQDANLTHPIRAGAGDLLARLRFHQHDFKGVQAILDESKALASSEAELRTLFARSRALADEPSRNTIGRVLFGDGPSEGTDPGLVIFLLGRFAENYPSDRLAPYLLGRQLARRDAKLGTRELLAACPSQNDIGSKSAEIPLPEIFQRECLRVLADTAFVAGDLDASQRAAEQLLPSVQTEAERLRTQDWLARIAWNRTTGP
jgi:hypothetical protein